MLHLILTRFAGPASRCLSPHRLTSLVLAAAVATGCDGALRSSSSTAVADQPSPPFRNVDSPTAFVGDTACSTCHASVAAAYSQHAMSQSFRPATPTNRIERPLDTPLFNVPTGLSYSVVDSAGALYQVEFLSAPGGRRLHELRRRVDHVMGSGHVARTYFTEENGRLFQLPLTWYRDHGWDFSPGYEINNARFDRLMPDRCLACHASYPRPIAHLEGKFAELRPGIGCERCHGPGALHAAERQAGVPRDGAYDRTIVSPARLPLARRLDVCEQCHVHTAVAVLRDGRDAFSYLPSQPLRDQWAFFKVAGSIDIVSHADRLRQSACFLATNASSRPLECATCHDPHGPPRDSLARNRLCQSCHASTALAQRFARTPSLADHSATSDCVSCHMPKVRDRAVPHGTFTDHWIRVVASRSAPPIVRRRGDRPIEPFFERDEVGPEASIYQGLGEIVYATMANDGRVLGLAASALDRALAKDTARGEAHFLLGVAYQQLGRTNEAIVALEHSLRVEPDSPETLHALAKAYELAGRPASAIAALYQRALGIQPALAWIRAEHAGFLQAQGLRDEAIEAYREALREQPSLAVAWFNLGTALAEAGPSVEASDAFRKAVHLDPELGQALSPLLEVRTAGRVVTSVRSLGSPLPSLPVRDRGPRAVQLIVSESSIPRARFINLPPRALVDILTPDGTQVRALPAGTGEVAEWDFLTARRTPIAGGLYRARIQPRDATGRSLGPQLLYFGVVRQRVE